MGFRLNWGIHDTGFALATWEKAGGYYLGEFPSSLYLSTYLFSDVGTSKLMREGKIKLKNDSQIACITKTGLEFENGSTLDADVIIFATGYFLSFKSFLRNILK